MYDSYHMKMVEYGYKYWQTSSKPLKRLGLALKNTCKSKIEPFKWLVFGTIERRNEGTIVRRNEGTKERRNDRAIERKRKPLQEVKHCIKKIPAKVK